jgi:hypothetical protein
MDGSKGRPRMTAGLNLGDKCSYLCVVDTDGGDASPQSSLCA